jgi:hypothetical protein
MAALAAGLALTGAAQAGESHGYNVYRPAPGVTTHGIDDHTTNSTYLVVRDDDHSGMARVVYANTTMIDIDPQIKYTGGAIGGLDHGHSIPRAQRLYNALHALPTRVVRNAPIEHDEMMQAGMMLDIQPKVIIEIPERFRQNRPAPQPQPDPAKKLPKQVASAM